MQSLIISIIEESLVLINKLVPDQVVVIQKKLNDYKEAWNAEMAKGDLRDDALLAQLDRELCDTGQLFLAAIKGSTLKDSQGSTH